AEAHAMLGEYLSRAGRKEAAWDARQAARALQEELVAASPTVGLKAGLSDNYNKLGRLALDAGRTDEARDYVRRALEISERLAREHPSIDSYQSHLAYVFRSMCMVEEKAGRPAEARAAVRRARAIDEQLAAKYPLNAFNLACDIAREWVVVANDPAEPDPKGAQQRLADEAMAAIRRAAALGGGAVRSYAEKAFDP